MKIAMAQINPTVGDFSGNAAKILSFAKEARAQNASVLLFPELSLVGYQPCDLLERGDFVSAAEKEFNSLLPALEKQAPGLAVVLGSLSRNSKVPGKALYNAAFWIQGGGVVAEYRKRLLPSYDVFDERRYFESGEVPVVVEHEGIKFGLSICEDAWNDLDFWEQSRWDSQNDSPIRAYKHGNLYSENPMADLVTAGADVLLNISASPYSLGKDILRYEMTKAHALKYGKPVLMCNQIGANDELVFSGHSFAFDGRGRLLACGKGFEEDLLFYDTTRISAGELTFSPLPMDSLRKALLLGIRDYFRKCGFSKTVIGLSGGIDSAVVLCLAVSALGGENVTALAMPSKYSSEGSVSDAKTLCQNLGLPLNVTPIQDIVDSYAKALAADFKGLPENVAEENIQARVRGNIVMAHANKFGLLPLTTGNKSELATGYCTLYGDMSGGLALISDVPKTMVYELAHELNRVMGNPIPKTIIDKAPSAELKPNQKDQDSLPPYEILDAVLKMYVEDMKSVEDIISAGYEESVVRKVIRLVRDSEYKRRQSAPGIKVTTKAFGFGRRIPIAKKQP